MTMDAFRQSRRLGRVLAAWLLLWFWAMAVPPGWGVPDGADGLLRVAADAGGKGAEVHHHGHDAPVPLHAGHGGDSAGSVQHCPLCMHAAAPALALPVLAWSGAAPQEQPAPRTHGHLRVRTDTPPPARAPPVLS